MKRELTSQELLERYISSVKMGLPPDKVEDIGAEIRSNLQSLLDDQAIELGREPRPEELSAILKQHGREPRPPARSFCGLAATFCWPVSSLLRVLRCCSPSGNIWSSDSDTRKDGSRSRCLLCRPRCDNGHRGLWFRLLVRWCGSSFGRWPCSYLRCGGSGAEGAFSGCLMRFTQCGCQFGC